MTINPVRGGQSNVHLSPQNKIRKGEKTMARERTVTRTITATILEAMTVNIETAEVRKVEYRVPSYGGTPKDLAWVKSQLETDTVKVVTITVIGTEDNLYSMPESLFIQLADKLPPRGETATGNAE